MNQNIAFIKIIQKRLNLKEGLHLLKKEEYWEKIYSINNVHKNTNIKSIVLTGQRLPILATEKKALPPVEGFSLIKYFFYEYIYKLLFFRLIPHYVAKKFHFWNKMFQNIFLTDEIKEQIWQIFYDVQKAYYGFARVATIYKFKKATIKINSDLYMNELTPSQKNVYTLLQDKSKYLFTVMDLTHIINTALSNLSYFFVSILEIKNPYNNVVINNATLYNIYFFIKQQHFIMPPLFQNFFLCHFDIYKFESDHEALIKTVGIENYAFKTPHNYLYEDIKCMFLINREYTKKLSIHKNFPRDKLVDIFRPYLHLYYIHKYYISGTVKKRNAMIELNRKLKDFVFFNPLFGRKIIKKQTNILGLKNILVKTETFNTDHILFNPDKMHPHLSVNFATIFSSIYMNNHLDDEIEIAETNDNADDNIVMDRAETEYEENYSNHDSDHNSDHELNDIEWVEGDIE